MIAIITPLWDFKILHREKEPAKYNQQQHNIYKFTFGS